MSSSNNDSPRTKGPSVISDKDGQSGKSSNVIRSGDGKRILYEDKDK